MKLIEPVKALAYSTDSYILLERILAQGAWKHRVHPYGMEQTKLIDSTLLHLQALLDGSTALDPETITGPISPDTILLVFKRSSSKNKTVLSFLYDDFNHDSPFAYFYRQLLATTNHHLQCTILGYDKLLSAYGLDAENTQNASSLLSLAQWYKDNFVTLSYANYGAWEWEGLDDFHSFAKKFMDCLKEHAILYGPNLLPTSYGMSVFDRIIRKKGIKLKLTDLEQMSARAFEQRVRGEKHKKEYPPFNVTLIGNMEAELTARAECAKIIHSSLGGCKL